MATGSTSKPSTRAGSLEPAHDILRTEHRPLEFFFQPKTVAVIGATDRDGSVGRTILWNLVSHPFGGTVFPVNPKRPSILGIKSYRNIAEVPEKIDLAVIVTPASTVPGIVHECVNAGVRGAIIISAGFKEAGARGVELEKQVLIEARRGKMRIVGPNCLGIMAPLTGLNATFAKTMARPGNVGFISQSGALCTAVLDWSFEENVGFSAFISVGSMADVGWGDLIDHLGDDPHTRSIILYTESIGDPRPFLSAAREVALTKPIMVLKAGRSEAAVKAATTHTGAIAGSEDVLDAAFRRCGILRVESIADLFSMAEVLAKQSRPHGPRLTIVTNAGGPGVLATDALIAHGSQLAELSRQTLEALDQVLPPHWSHGNPIDIIGDADSARYSKAIEIAARDSNTDGLLAILTPQAMTDPTQTAENLKRFAHLEGKPLLASWMGGSDVAAGRAILNRAGIPTFAYPDAAARAFSYMWKYSYNLRGLYETPTLPSTPLRDGERSRTVPATDDVEATGRPRVEQIIQAARQKGRTILTEVESKQILEAYRIPVVATRVAASEEEAIHAAGETGYPVVLKLFSETLTHKTDVGGVRLNLTDEDAVRQAYREIEASVGEKKGSGHFLGVAVEPMVKLEGYELILGSAHDEQFGPVLLFGAGGQWVEIFKDRAMALPPLNTTLARRMMEQTRIWRAFEGARGRAPVNTSALAELLVRFSHLVVSHRRIREIDVNPFLVSGDTAVALDARIVLHGSEVNADQLPGLVIRPYPTQYAAKWKMKDGTPVTIRPIRPEDEPLMVRFHESLSERSVYLRYFHSFKLDQRIAHERLTRVCFPDYDREMALVAEVGDAKSGAREVIAVGRLSKMHGTNEAEVALMVSDPYQDRGLGTEILRRLIDIGRQEKLQRIHAEMLSENFEMHRLCEKVGFRLYRLPDDPTVRAVLDIA